MWSRTDASTPGIIRFRCRGGFALFRSRASSSPEIVALAVGLGPVFRMLTAMPDRDDLLTDARLYLCTDSRSRQGDFAEFVDAVMSEGVDIVQLRQKGLEAQEELRLLEVLAEAAHRNGKLFAVNDRADVAAAADADVLHLGQGDLPVPVARRIVGPEPLIGRSTHSPAQVTAASDQVGVDYFCAGPVWST